VTGRDLLGGNEHEMCNHREHQAHQEHQAYASFEYGVDIHHISDQKLIIQIIFQISNFSKIYGKFYIFQKYRNFIFLHPQKSQSIGETLPPILLSRVFFSSRKKSTHQKIQFSKVWELYFSASLKIAKYGRNFSSHTFDSSIFQLKKKIHPPKI
jgi:hypothetical protein